MATPPGSMVRTHPNVTGRQCATGTGVEYTAFGAPHGKSCCRALNRLVVPCREPFLAPPSTLPSASKRAVGHRSPIAGRFPAHESSQARSFDTSLNYDDRSFLGMPAGLALATTAARSLSLKEDAMSDFYQLSAVTLSGKNVSMRDFAGKAVLVALLPALPIAQFLMPPQCLRI
jgi:hypothetical protein